MKCGQCGEQFCLLTTTYELLRRSSRTFFCPWGHERHYPQGPSENDKLRQERDRLKQDQARLQDEIRTLAASRQLAAEARDRAERRASAARGQVTRLKNRAAAGVCPCCNRQFENLRRHMESKHKGFALEETAPIGETIQ
jgi:DNA repair exonuclease SbcCD ATPase subunit